MNTPHPPSALRQYSDQMFCSHCGKSWDVNDVDPPQCKVSTVKTGSD